MYSWNYGEFNLDPRLYQLVYYYVKLLSTQIASTFFLFEQFRKARRRSLSPSKYSAWLKTVGLKAGRMYMCHINVALRSLMVGFLLFALIVTGEKKRIVSGAIWNDDAGKRIQAHGGCLLQLKDQWYWFGEDKEKGHKFKGCYRSDDLLTWTRLPNVLTSTAGTPLNENMVVERPRVLFNQATNKFVMYFHYDLMLTIMSLTNTMSFSIGFKKWSICSQSRWILTSFRIFDWKRYKLAQIGVATSDKASFYPLVHTHHHRVQRLIWHLGILLCNLDEVPSKQIDSDWKFVRAFSPLNSQSRDLSLFQDDDGTGYVIFASDGNANLKLARLSEDYKGWSANPNKVIKASDLAGPWSKDIDITDPKLNTYSSQNTHDLTVIGTQARSHIWTKYDIPAGNSGQMSVNGGGKFNVYYPPTSAQISIPVPVHLKPGGENSIDMVIPSGVKVQQIILY
ncbi:family 43 glycoside hydrolase [Melampsora larici-populina 98AG31]|uniref:Family 43 glycoside hydrolase n=1 Tax=Melampsora larici-populina (strain 98AG31 / pathotype 3-4-7) TaxID=747676 RepID=F4R611_MELLP|nr:family 43 glycoside hydrolase [Melampsora larici-populina 98AG31]EGG12137.1 family 43 glycoside hydrolase [Melampsora larici-populina 98AG31]